jgi:hypothetical protein
MRTRALLVGVLLLAASSATAQVPGTDVYVLRMRDGLLAQLSPPRNLTSRPGYDNQPAFIAEGAGLRYTAIDSMGQADIWFANPEDGPPRRLTATETSEYSPTPIPGSDRFSVVQVEADSTQRLWSFGTDGSDPRLVLPEPAGVGYHAWGEAGELVLFVLGSPHELHRARAGEPGSIRVARDIGRCLARIPGEGAWSFPLADGEGGWNISRLDAATGEITSIAPTPDPDVEDYAWTPEGELWSSDGSSILAWREGEWKVVRHLASDGIRGISRMAVSPDGSWFAFVAADEAGNR